MYEESRDHYHQASSKSPSRGQDSTIQTHLASSSQILGSKRQVPWWLRENRRRLGDLAEASSSQSIRMQAQAMPTVSRPQSAMGAASASATGSPGTHTMFLPAYASGQPQARPSGLHSNIRTFVQHVYDTGRNIFDHGSPERRGPIYLQTQLSKKDKALWNWVNVDDLDEFLQEVYTFYVRKGIWSIALSGFLDLL